MRFIRICHFILKGILTIPPFVWLSTLVQRVAKRLQKVLSRWAAILHQRMTMRAERKRIRRASRSEECKNNKIISEIIKYSKRTLFYLSVVIVISTAVDLLGSYLLDALQGNQYLHIFLSPSSNALTTGLEIYIGAISAVLGLVFALYAVGFQLSTDKYSERVASFINQERVSSFLFRFLVFTDLFAIAVYLKLITFDHLPVFSFYLATMFVGISLLGVIIFKNHLVEFIKPVSLMSRLSELVTDEIFNVSKPNNYRYKSWNLATQSREKAAKNFQTLTTIYRDLTREDSRNGNRWDDAVYAVAFSGQLLKGYARRKRYIELDKQWWASETFEKVKADNLATYELKFQHEIKGTGPLFMPKPDPDWFENRVFEFLGQAEEDIPRDKTHKLFVRLSDAYKEIMVGDKEKQKDAPPRIIPGAWHSQEFSIFDKALKSFQGIRHKIDLNNEDTLGYYLNDYFATVTEVIEPWDYELGLRIARSFYLKDGRLNTDTSFLVNYDLPTVYRGILHDYWQRLEVEQKASGRIVTPQSALIAELTEVFNERLQEKKEEVLKVAFTDTSNFVKELTTAKNMHSALQVIKIQMEWISHLMYSEQGDIADNLIKYMQKTSAYVFVASKDDLLEEEMLEQAEKGYFVAINEEKKRVFEVYARALVLIWRRSTIDEKDPDKVIRTMRQAVIWGAHAYAMSELRQDHFWVSTFTKEMLIHFPQDVLIKIMELAADNPAGSSDTFWEATRYGVWERSFAAKVQNEVKQVMSDDPFEYGFSTHLDHPSRFIQSMGRGVMDAFLMERRAAESYVEWLKKRQAIGDIIKLLSERAGNKDE